MKILIITTDLYKSIGGGQAVYKKIIESTPDVEFFYFVTDETSDAKRPPNAHPVPSQNRRRLNVLTPPPFASYKVHQLEMADQYARSVAGEMFDIVDLPDFYYCGSLLKHAFAHHHVKVGRVVLALHGNISDSIERNWFTDDNQVQELRMMELAQFKAADAAYGISPRYIKTWQAQYNRDVAYINPAHFIDATINSNSLSWASGQPSLYCIGRTERRKGNDLFIELVRWLKRSSFKVAAHVGDEDYSAKGISSKYLLENIAKQRNIDIEYQHAMSRVQLETLFAGRSIVILPVRYDTLNLVALEALFSGCPVAVSDSAGVCDYLDQFHPKLPYLKIDFNNFYETVGKLQNLIDNYDHHRIALLDYLESIKSFSVGPLVMSEIYQKIIETQENYSSEKSKLTIVYEESSQPLILRAIRMARQMLPQSTYQSLRRFALDPKRVVLGKIKKSGYLGDAKFIENLISAMFIPWHLKKIANYSEASIEKINKKLNNIYGKTVIHLYRCNFWQEIARIQRILGNELTAVTYEIRILRLLGDDRLGLLPNVVETLNKHGFCYEAEVAIAMYSNAESADENVYKYLKGAYKRNLVRHNKPWQLIEDYRGTFVPKVSVIVSLYKAADKLRYFLTALSQQTLLKAGNVEVILVDSGSPTNEYEVIADYLKDTPLNAVYARSVDRETIQAAWNRGIGLARSPYLVFLGVDETLFPEALETLANELDENQNIDWVMANSFITTVEKNGIYKNDVMAYNRNGATKDHTYLETCYLSWVGGMYRSSLHTRFGYYDETFGAAGDTEFKNRILPHINVKYIPQMLGLFLNYPDGQTTASPKAEIEDLRAWYVHRTSGGVRYAYENRTTEDVQLQLSLALGYRKSYCGHISCDIEYATYLAQYLKANRENLAIVNSVLPNLETMLSQLRGLELANTLPSRLTGVFQLVTIWRSIKKYQQQHREIFKSKASPSYSIFNDNRYEQHSWLWT